MKKKIAIVGAGQLGSRHLQGLALLKRDAEIFLVDPSESSLNLSRERHQQIQSGSEQNLHLLKSISELPKRVDLGIVACTADIRFDVLRQLSNCVEIENLILEKVLFQNLDEYDAVLELPSVNPDKTWVNFAQRLWPFFIDLKERFYGDRLLEINISGSNWGLGCNSVHNVDLARFLWSAQSVTRANLDSTLLPSKRANFVEFSGEVITDVEGGGRIRQVCYATGDAPFVVSVNHPELKQVWDISNGRLFTSTKENGWLFEQTSVIPPYQSNLTTHVSEAIFSHLDCGLPKLVEACGAHVDTLRALLQSAESSGHNFGRTCPVT